MSDNSWQKKALAVTVSEGEEGYRVEFRVNALDKEITIIEGKDAGDERL